MAKRTDNYILAKKIADFLNERSYIDWKKYGITELYGAHYFWNRVNAIKTALKTVDGRKDVIESIYEARYYEWITRTECVEFVNAVTALGV